MQSPWKSVRSFLKDLNIESPDGLVLLFLAIYLTDSKSSYYRHSCLLLPCSNTMIQTPTPEMLVSRWRDKENVVHMHNGHKD